MKAVNAAVLEQTKVHLMCSPSSGRGQLYRSVYGLILLFLLKLLQYFEKLHQKWHLTAIPHGCK